MASTELTVAQLWRWLTDADLSDPTVAARLLQWAPDVCALTGVLLERSHAFRFVVSPPTGHSWPPQGAESFQARVVAAASAWRAAMDAGGPPPADVERLWAVVRDHLDTAIAVLAEGRPWALCEAVFALHAIADEATAGTTRGGPGPTFRAKARELLTRTGTEARLPADRVALLPKGRTTGVGITHRSVSRYVAAAWDGIEVVWHRAPMQRPGSSAFARHANVLLLPWPLTIAESDFVPVPGSIRRPEREPFGFFTYEPSEGIDLSLIDRLIDAALAQVDGVDVVVLPEGALNERQVAEVEGLLRRRGVPMLVSGLRPDPAEPDLFPANCVHTGLLVGPRWWHYRQQKHHRWFLDAGQIGAYDIGSALDPGVRWWEAMEIPKRAVHLLDLGGGITVAAVVCEDLARLDGVAELLRSVAPTLVLTLLLDGPQLASRWTARYAGVLADDPGSAVLTLTALGMATRSRPRGMPPSRVIAMWKDPARGLREIACEEQSQAVLLEVALGRSPRHAADGRAPVDDVTDFHLADVHQLVAAPASPVTAPNADRPTELGEPGLDAAELSVLSGWAEAVAAAMVDRGSVDDVLAHASRGAAWRATVGAPEPSDRLQAAVDLLADLGRQSLTISPEPTVRGLRRALDACTVPDDPQSALVRVVLEAGLDSLGAGRVSEPGSRRSSG